MRSNLFIISFTLILSYSLAQNESNEPKSTIDLIQHQILPQKLEIVFKKLQSKCRLEVEVPMRSCLKDYGDHTSHAKLLQNDFQEVKRIGCCGVYRYENCIVSLVRSQARESKYCSEEDVSTTLEVMESGRIDPKLSHLCYGYHENSFVCRNEPIEMWLLVLVWTIGASAIVIALAGAVCMLYLFVTSGSKRPRIFILSTNRDGTKSLIENMDQ